LKEITEKKKEVEKKIEEKSEKEKEELKVKRRELLDEQKMKKLDIRYLRYCCGGLRVHIALLRIRIQF
jgi:hypothetical protein